jgi:hypothetical protein
LRCRHDQFDTVQPLEVLRLLQRKEVRARMAGLLQGGGGGGAPEGPAVFLAQLGRAAAEALGGRAAELAELRSSWAAAREAMVRPGAAGLSLEALVGLQLAGQVVGA